jgi:signal peptidase II
VSDASKASTTDPVPPRAGALMKRPLFILFFLAISGLLIGFDQWTKVLAERLLAGRGSIPVLGDFVVLVFAQNSGAFLSLGAGLSEPGRVIGLIILPSLLLITAIVYFFVKQKPSVRNLAMLCLLTGGGFGNIIDRVFKTLVTDFLNFGIGKLRTGVMNVADLYIMALVIMLLIGMIGERKQGKASQADAAAGKDKSE